MRAMSAEGFIGYKDLKLVDIPKLAVSDGRVLVRIRVWTTAWTVIVSLLQSGAVKPIVAKTFPLAEAADALRYLVEGRPFGRVVLTI